MPLTNGYSINPVYMQTPWLRNCVCVVLCEFVLYGSIMAFYVPLLIMLVTYSLTVRILRRNHRLMEMIAQGSVRHRATKQQSLTDGNQSQGGTMHARALWLSEWLIASCFAFWFLILFSLIQLIIINSKNYQFINVVNGVGRSHKTANIFFPFDSVV